MELHKYFVCKAFVQITSPAPLPSASLLYRRLCCRLCRAPRGAFGTRDRRTLGSDLHLQLQLQLQRQTRCRKLQPQVRCVAVRCCGSAHALVGRGPTLVAPTRRWYQKVGTFGTNVWYQCLVPTLARLVPTLVRLLARWHHAWWMGVSQEEAGS